MCSCVNGGREQIARINPAARPSGASHSPRHPFTAYEMPMPQSTSEFTPRSLLSVGQFSELHPAWSEPALRNLILNAEDRLSSRGERIPGNGLQQAGAILRVGRRVLIDEAAYFRWIAAQQHQRRNVTAVA
jgi:hypothetical protein